MNDIFLKKEKKRKVVAFLYQIAHGQLFGPTKMVVLYNSIE